MNRKEQWWLFWYIILIFTIVFLTAFCISFTMNVGADTPAHDEQEVQSGNDGDGFGREHAQFGRQMNGTLWVFSVWEDPADTLNRYLYGYFSTDGGATYNRITVSHSDDAGYEPDGYPRKISQVMILSNNSIILLIYDFKYWGSHNRPEISLLCHWNNSDLGQWDRYCGWSSAVYSPDHLGGNVNGVDEIVFCYEWAGTYNLFTISFNPVTRAIAQIWMRSNTFIATNIFVEWNGTAWNILFASSGAQFYVYCYNANDASPDLLWSAGLGANYYVSDIVLSKTGVYAWTRKYSTLYSWAYIGFRNATGDVFYKKIAADNKWTYGKLGINNMNGDYFTFTSFNYDTDRFGWWGSTYWKSEAHWQATQTDCFQEDYDMQNNEWKDQSIEMPNSRYPIDPATGNHTQLPHSLGGPIWMFHEYDDSDGCYDLWVDFETTWPGIQDWTYDPWGIPYIVDKELPDGQTGWEYSHKMTGKKGKPPYTWQFWENPSWLEIDPFTGVISGTPMSPGEYYVKIRLIDMKLNTDTETYIITVAGEKIVPGRKLNFPFSIDTIIEALWWLFILFAMLIACLDVVMRIRKKVSREGKI